MMNNHADHPHGSGVHSQRVHGGPLVRFVKNLSSEMASQLLTLMTSAFGLVAALAWNDAVQALFKQLFPAAGSIVAKFLYAILVSVIIVVVTINLTRLSHLARNGFRQGEK